MSVRIFWAGDSTVADNRFDTYPQTGIGQAMRLYLNPEVELYNYAVNGRSTKSFLDESRLAAIYDRIGKDDYLFVQFGHNDEKKEDPSRYTECWGEFCDNLERFVNAARNKRAYPVLITPLYRRLFEEDGCQESQHLEHNVHQEYPEAVKMVGNRLSVPVIDLCGASEALLRRTAPAISEHWFMNLKPEQYPSCPEGKVDNTHLTGQGAVIFAELIAEGLKDLGGRYAELLESAEKLHMPIRLDIGWTSDAS